MLSASQADMVAETLRIALMQAAQEAGAGQAAPLLAGAADRLTVLRAAAGGGGAAIRPPHPALPGVSASARRELVVGAEDTAASMGHPDPSVNALGSPRIALWFEIVASELLPRPAADLTHVGVGILVHHLARAEVGERVSVEARVAMTAGRRVAFWCAAAVGDRMVALGVHQRVLLEQR